MFPGTYVHSQGASLLQKPLNGRESLFRDGTKTRWWLQWMLAIEMANIAHQYR